MQVGVEITNKNDREVGIVAMLFFQGIEIGSQWCIWHQVGAK